ncbi:alpha/beta fold hydrolase [Actinoplanes sp. NPDC049599]|uniref:alpha/beta fold hydrolase n=1 Tax=Actinoplanes sp. NPDC049599 TaxID=3363903 RepID=UPI0037BACB6F
MRVITEDGTEAVAVDEGSGPPILVIHGGMGDRTVWQPVTDLLRDRFRTVRLERRRYRMDLPGPVTMPQEVEHVAAIAAELDRPVLVGHSSGAVVALEALVANPGAYAGAVLYEPPVVIGPPLSADKLAAARAALARDKPGKALAIFVRDVVRMPAPLAWLAGALVGRHPQYRRRVGRQLDDNDAIDELGVRLPVYARLELPILLLGGDRSPRHLTERLDALERALPHTRRVPLHGQGHNAERRAPQQVATAIATFVNEDLARR